MKRQIAAILIAALVLCSLTGCSEGDLENRPGTSGSVSDGFSSSSVTDGSSSSSENTSPDPKSEGSTLENSSIPESKPIEKVTGV